MKRLWTTLALFTAYQSWACCGVGSGQVKFLGQEDIVIWNSKTQTEHFIRSANFKADGKDIGFIAPSPTIPNLALANQSAFNHLEALRPQPFRLVIGCGAASAAAEPAADASLEIAQIVDLGQYEATTLRSTNSSDLTRYLNAHGYKATMDIESWANYYLKRRWYLTAFKLKVEEKSSELSPIRMSFKTSTPFFPYFVPSSNRSDEGSRLRVMVLAEGIASASVLQKSLGSSDWNVPVSKETRYQLARDLQVSFDDLGEATELTVWDSLPFPSDAKDDAYLTFTPRLPLWADLLLYGCAGFFAVYVYRWLRLRRHYSALKPSPSADAVDQE